MESTHHLQNLFSDVPFHELEGKDISKMNDKELEAFIATTRAVRVAPSERKKLRTTGVKELTGKKKKTSKAIEEDLNHLI